MADKSDAMINCLRVLAEGCRKHPAYRARRPATGNCEPCVRMWQARQVLDTLESDDAA